MFRGCTVPPQGEGDPGSLGNSVSDEVEVGYPLIDLSLLQLWGMASCGYLGCMLCLAFWGPMTVTA